MNLCSHNHEEIYYEGIGCPLCDKKKTVDALNEENFDLACKNSDLTNELAELKRTLSLSESSPKGVD